MTATYDAQPDYDEPPPPGVRVPPQDIPAEESVLGGMLLSKDAIGDVLSTLEPRDFYRPAHETIYSTILDMYGRGDPADPITVAAELHSRGELQRCGGPAYLHRLVTATPTAANAEYYAGVVREKAVFRRLAETGTRIAARGYEAAGSSAEAADAAGAELLKATEARTGTDPRRVSTQDTVDEIERRANLKGHLSGVPTGFIDLDSLTNGLQPGQMIVVAARPAMGKSTLALDFARACSIKNGMPSVFFSLEMGRQEIQERLLSAEGKIALHHLKSGQMEEEDWARVARVQPRIDGAPLFIDDAPDLSVMSIRAKCRKMKAKYGLKLVVVDYLQLLSSGSRRPESRQQEVSEMSRSFKLLAKELEVPVVALSQLNRGPEQRTDKKPMVSDLRESGSIEQDADMVILLHREDAYEKASARSGEADLIVGKHRNGPTCTITVAFQGHYARFVDMA